ncbi:MAG: hypothetical protein GY892_02615, partial [Shimia sp.]|nr:hypothetical protein [Shimia sp.]
MSDRLNVTLDFGAGSARRTLGQLGRDPRNRSFAFEWNPAFTSDPLPVWPIRLKSPSAILWSQRWRRRSVPGLFEDSLPDGWGKLLLDREIRASAGAGTMLDDMERWPFSAGTAWALCATHRTPPLSTKVTLTLNGSKMWCRASRMAPALRSSKCCAPSAAASRATDPSLWPKSTLITRYSGIIETIG